MSEFATRLIAWQKVHGRHDLPWQNTRDPYAIWVSEIMLQQTQVTAVIGYYAKFMQRFPDIATLANATQEEVLQYWSGLGYYSRARNLHKAAQTIMAEHGGQFPQDFEVIQQLSGIGRSTAAAIASFAFNQPQTILDGNVKRVLARHYLVEGWPGLPKVEKQLWVLAEGLLPEHGMVAYTQGLMDLGATLCTRSKPKCLLCPLNSTCSAYQQNRVKELPASKPRKVSPQKQTTMLLLLNGNEVMLEKRPSSGIWGGLWSLPEIGMHEIAVEVAASRFGLQTEVEEPLPLVNHAFTHFKLEITPQPLQLLHKPLQANAPNIIWLPIEDAIDAALPTPVRNILKSLK
ncbi:A/G-specific adenine glycosylase [Methyloradius palustris]|uniref:Adenine DNA glycosylase n=1 Tax=Methyloradius palustris TaxID=2778876 RepID=A0A8D5G5P4_9PROT|nr:A/G-specific adenine glycosylase [Methyloradius palustris]BCM26160.1 A/G-specific adenine glycosylase [Methyloradius palustris]